MDDRKRKKHFRNKKRKMRKKAISNDFKMTEPMKIKKSPKPKFLNIDTRLPTNSPKFPQNKFNRGVKRKITATFNGNDKPCPMFKNKVNKTKNNQPMQSISDLPYTNNSEKLSTQRKSLPIFDVREELVKLLAKHNPVIVMGETGSGKTTQIPQYIHEDGLDKDGAICITQPRRVAAISIAKRIAEEMNSPIGKLVGYSVRFEDVTSPETKIKFVTDGMLLRESISDPLLLKYQWILLDEVHERSLNTDILFGIVKTAQKRRRLLNRIPLHIIIMSATMDINNLSCYFNNAFAIDIEGREHKIDLYHAKQKHGEEYAVSCMRAALQIHQKAPAQEDILVFLSGQEEIDAVTRTLHNLAKDPCMKEFPTLKVLPFYAALPSHFEHSIFQPSKKGERKIIVCTNIAETSITIPGVKYVVDSGRVKIRTYDAKKGLDILRVRKISKAQAHQRCGRAGREGPGFCYRLYSWEEYESMPMNATPEILRVNLSNVFLQLLAIGVQSVTEFDFIDKPPSDNIKKAESCLKSLEAITVKDNCMFLTDLGQKMTNFPIDPCFSKILISASTLGCSEEAASIIALLTSESIYVNPSQKREEATDIRAKFSCDGDHLTLLKILKAFRSSKNSQEWCWNHFLNYRNLTYAVRVKKQLHNLCLKNDIPMTSCGDETDLILRSLINGLFTNVAELQRDGKYITLHDRQEAKLHPSSILFGSKPQYVLYTELVKTNDQVFMRTNSAVEFKMLLDVNLEYFEGRRLKNFQL